jgi:hypothetical protein
MVMAINNEQHILFLRYMHGRPPGKYRTFFEISNFVTIESEKKKDEHVGIANLIPILVEWFCFIKATYCAIQAKKNKAVF